MANKCFDIDLAPVPMAENMFDRFIPDIISKMEDQEDDFLTIGYMPVREDHIKVIQTCRNGKGYHVELVICPNRDPDEFRIYEYDTDSFEEAVHIFRQVCVYMYLPADYSWKDITNLTQYED